MQVFGSFLTIIALFYCVEAQKFGLGQCPRTFPVQGFDVTRYLGKWYEIKTYPNFFQNHVCTEANYGPLFSNGQVNVLNKELDSKGQAQAVRGFARMQQMGSGNLKVTLQTPAGQQESDYDVLGTDYNWALVHACRSILGIKVEFAWILSRTRHLSIENQLKIDQLMVRNGLDSSALKVTRQDGCPNMDMLPYKYIA